MKASRAATCRKKGTPAYWEDSDNVLAFEVDTGVSTGSGLITSWADAKSGRTQPLTPHSGQTGPSYQADDGDGFPAARFNGTTDLLSRTSFTPLDLDNDWTFAGILWTDASTGVGLMGFGDYPTPGRYIWYRAGANLLNSQAAGTTGSPVSSGNQTFSNGWHFVHGRKTGSSFALGLDGSEGAPSTPTTPYAAATLTMGGCMNSAPGVLLAACRWRSFAAWNADIGSTRRAALRTFWKAKWPGLP